MAAAGARAVAGSAAALMALAAAGAAPAREVSAIVLLGPDGAAEARVVTDAANCPAIFVDGRARRMRLRAAAGEAKLRPTVSDPALSKPSDFPVATCEARLPARARRVTVAGQLLALSKPIVRRTMGVGDTSCRLNAPNHAYQACNDPKAYPFAAIARRAAAWRPDLVLHVGDYEYRETPCPPEKADCAGSPWGYGWDAWRADFFAPAEPLLAAAPWVAVRGNHEDCARAGQGWMRFLDARPLAPGRDCDDPANDATTDDAAPYAVPLGGAAQLVVLDMTTAPNAALKPGDPRRAQFAADYAALERLAARAPYTLLALHKPILGFGAVEQDGRRELMPNTLGIQAVFAEQNPAILPKGVGVVLSGHLHLWQQLAFSSDHPSQFIAGFSGTQEDVVPMPDSLPPGASPAPGAQVAAFSHWIAGFGYMTLERRRADRWDVKVWNLAGEVVNRCRIEGRRSRCEKAGVG